MWENLAIFVLRYRLYFLFGLIALTGFMGLKALETQIAYDMARVVPEKEDKYQNFLRFRETFGEDGNLLVIGLDTRDLFKLDIFNSWYNLAEDISNLDGIDGVLSVPFAIELVKDTANTAFRVERMLDTPPASQADLDSFKLRFLKYPFFEGFIHNQATSTSLMAVTFSLETLDSQERQRIVKRITNLGEVFEEKFDTELHYSGLPFIRSFNMTTISHELKQFLLFAMIILAVLLFVLFRNLSAVILPLIVVVFGAIWCLGILVLLGYKITILTGLLPTLIVVIGIPNCVYLINKYHAEFRKHGNKQKALVRTVSKIGHVTFFTNLTTAIGFGVFYFTQTRLLDEFGIVAFLSIVATFLISIILLSVVFSYLPEPKVRHTEHLDRKVLTWLLDRLEDMALNHRKMVYVIFLGVLAVAIVGLTRLQAEGYILDDVSKHSKVYKDLKFFEKEFHGIMPLEILIDTEKERGATDRNFLRKLDQLSDTLSTLPVFAKPLSIVDGYKMLIQAYYNGNPNYYRLPTNFELTQNPVLRSYLRSVQFSDGKALSFRFIDSTASMARLSLRMADIGSDSMPKLLAQIQPIIDSIFPPESSNVTITGTSIIAIEGFNFLIDGLVFSVGLAFILIALIMAYLFRSVKMLLLSLIPNVFPLLVTAGLMGYLGIPLKPSTVLIFSIAFGISVDYTIHFLAKYKQELYWHRWDIVKTVRVSLRETGVSMMYTSLILFFGFIVFTGSAFDGTVNLGRLTSITLVVAMLSNLVFLPTLLVSLNWLNDRKAMRKEQQLDGYNEDEDNDLDKLDLKYDQET